MAEGLNLTAVPASLLTASPMKKAIWLGLALLVVIAAGLLFKERQPDYRVLFASLSDRDGGAVVEALERLNIPYRLAEPNGAVEVPADQLHAARYKLAVQGLPKGDKRDDEPSSSMAGFGLSQFQEQIGYQRALEDELARSVRALDGVESARVHLALPRQTSFLRERIPPAASVLLKLKPPAQLDEEQVESIRHIVASSVPGMTTSQVSVVDQSGTLLAAGVAGLYRGLSPDQLEYTRRLENEYSERLAKVLTPVLQAHAYKVQITAQVDFSESEETTENASQSGKSTVYSRKTTRHVREPKGTVGRLAVLVVVDEAAGLEKNHLDKIERLARQAVGFDTRRRDSVQVITVPFSPMEAARQTVNPESLKNMAKSTNAMPAPAAGGETWPVYAGLMLAALAGVFLVWRLMKRGRHGRKEEIPEAAGAHSAGEIFEAELNLIRQRVMEDPKVAASVVKLWMQA